MDNQMVGLIPPASVEPATGAARRKRSVRTCDEGLCSSWSVESSDPVAERCRNRAVNASDVVSEKNPTPSEVWDSLRSSGSVLSPLQSCCAAAVLILQNLLQAPSTSVRSSCSIHSRCEKIGSYVAFGASEWSTAQQLLPLNTHSSLQPNNNAFKESSGSCLTTPS